MQDSGATSQPSWPIYVISLRSATARRAHCAELLANLGLRFEFYDAVEGAALPSDELARLYSPHKNAHLYKHPLSLPEMGCTLSHYNLWQRISSNPESGAFLLEDDFQADPALPQIMGAISRLRLTNCMIKLFARGETAGDEVGVLPGGFKLILPRRVPGQTVGYAVDSIAAARLAARMLPMGRPIDMDIKHWWEFDVPVLAVRPSPLTVNLHQTGSSIEDARREKKPAGNSGGVLRTWRNLRYQLAYNLGVLQHRHREREHLQRLRNDFRSAQ